MPRQPPQTYDIKFKDLSTGQMLPDVIQESSGSFTWGADASTVYYEKMDAAHRYAWRDRRPRAKEGKGRPRSPVFF